ncbi:hypothetical protein TVAG_385220 [Trichomonas vaginalis G3]|uniref:Uncharacterized protein n=1 Tax=Trichomonas vaginalis (strain ATCC PRA-98 / G3) TaxID=412133 RepID=A2FIY5_TRIV3|nr:hypothetical protein TVAGG3_0794580 [Trichomonas vaginalis G3]EAX95134.1 hypothetical protein TVAG_385220 [Trichomonas vaginalis G3]KAI5496067.1 hypothetical protein TVAGG3_0794580 [Trichomonas vaginalis G3]|eukprot:XP_001308064.1 hypothetical protein [Trichomonas vaginalis G3]
MYRAPKVVNRIIDRQVRLDKDRKHFEALRDLKPAIDISRPPLNPRLVVYEKRQAIYRQNLMYEEAMKYRELAEIERNRGKTPHQPKTDFQTFLNSLKQSNRAKTTLQKINYKQDKNNTRNDDLVNEETETKQEKVVDDNGMKVVDKNPETNVKLNTIRPILRNSTFQTTPSPEPTDLNNESTY